MKCIVTAGPTYEELDEVRRMTNFSTGSLGTGLADYLAFLGHDVELLTGYYSTCPPSARAQRPQTFTTTADLRERLAALASPDVGAVFHAAAVSDFTFGKIWERTATGELREINSAKIPTRAEEERSIPAQVEIIRHAVLDSASRSPLAKDLLAELKPTPKIIRELRGWFPEAFLVGWKYELETQGHARFVGKSLGMFQILANKTDACVMNGRGFGQEGFGLLFKDGNMTQHPDKPSLFAALGTALADRA